KAGGGFQHGFVKRVRGRDERRHFCRRSGSDTQATVRFGDVNADDAPLEFRGNQLGAQIGGERVYLGASRELVQIDDALADGEQVRLVGLQSIFDEHRVVV